MRVYHESVTTGQTHTRTDGETDAGQSDPYEPLYFAGDTNVKFKWVRIPLNDSFSVIGLLSKIENVTWISYEECQLKCKLSKSVFHFLCQWYDDGKTRCFYEIRSEIDQIKLFLVGFSTSWPVVRVI